MKFLAVITALAIGLTNNVYTVVSDYNDFISSYEVAEEQTVCCSVNAENISLGEIISPRDITFNGENCAEIFVKLLENEGFTPVYSGTTDEWFYLSAIEGIDTSNASIPDNIKTFLDDNKVEYSGSVLTEGTLSEFDFTNFSGWIFTVNGETPSVGMCDYTPENGDEIKLCFTLYYGEDLMQ